jgi:hypothetical protein
LYFAHSPKKVAEIRTQAQLIETKGLKLLNNIKTTWISCISPLWTLINEFKSMMAKMHPNKDDKKSGKKAIVSFFLVLIFIAELRMCIKHLLYLDSVLKDFLLCTSQVVLQKILNPYMIVSMLAIISLLEEIDALVNFAQMLDVFISNFVGGGFKLAKSVHSIPIEILKLPFGRTASML